MRRRYVYLVEARPVDDAGVEQPQYWSAGQAERPMPYGDHEWINCLEGTGDRLSPFTFTREIPIDLTVGGRSVIGYGSLRLNMRFIPLSHLVHLHWDARAVRIWRVLEGSVFALTDPPLFRGTMDTPDFGTRETQVPLFDGSRRLDVPVQQNVFAGTGGYEGYPDLKGVQKPLILGRGEHFEPVPIDHSAPGRKLTGTPPVEEPAFSRVVQLSDGGISLQFIADWLSFYERAVKFNPAVVEVVADVYEWSPVGKPGHIAVDTTRGYARFATPPGGVTTCEARAGDVPLHPISGPLYTHANIARYAVRRQNVLAADEIDEPALAALNAVIAAAVGIYVQDARTCAEVMDTLSQSCGSAWSFTPAGLFTMRQIGFRASRDIIRKTDLVEDLRPIALPPPIWRFRYSHSPIERVLTDSDLGNAVVIPQVRELVSQPFRSDVYELPSVRATRPLAREGSAVSRMMFDSASAAEGSRQAALLRQHRHGFVATAWRDYGALQEGDTITLVHNEWGLESGRDYLIRAKAEQPAYAVGKDVVELTLWGPFVPGEDRRLAA